MEFLDLSRDFEGNSKQSEENQTEIKEKNRYGSTGHRNCSIYMPVKWVQYGGLTRKIHSKTHIKNFTRTIIYSLNHTQDACTVKVSPCGHPIITDTPIIRTAAKSHVKIYYFFEWNKLSLFWTL